MENFTKLLFATDFSFVSEYAMSHALALARALEARLLILHVTNVSLDLCRRHEPHASYDKIKAEITKTAEKRLDEFCEKRLRYWNSLHKQDFTDYEKCVVFGVPYKEVLKKADEENADLLVMGTHSRHVIDPYVFGSTAERVLKYARCPVITVRPPFWMVCMKFRDNPALPLRRHGSFISVRETVSAAGSDAHSVDECPQEGPDPEPVNE
jgi:nucleotide-binding universal stress UspA family protein